jgi:hypothetical protein
MDDVTHREIYDRLVEVESKVDSLDKKTTEVVTAFNAAKGAFLVLEWIGKIAKPIIWVVGISAVLITAYEKFKSNL